MADSSTAEKTSNGLLSTMRPYNPPTWALQLIPIPSHVLSLAHVPTPIHKWNLQGLPPNTEVYIKREDLCGLQLTGNKVRRLEFFLAEAVSLGADCVITIGARQSNHCRATAVAANYLNLDCFLILITDESLAEEDPGLSGNLLIERLVGAHIEQASWEEFFKYGSMVPTPIHKWNLPGLPPNTEVYIKREDLCGLQLTGNKARKLEFVLAEAVSIGADCVITIGGTQSNHCRATAVAAKYLNLDCFLILITDESLAEEDPGLSGNLLIERLVGAHIEQASWEEFFKYGSTGLLNSLKAQLEKNGRTPYIVPIGASNALGTWGYIDAVREIEQQLQQQEFNDINFDAIVAPCGSCGTIVGLSLGSSLSAMKAEVHAFSVGEEPDSCYEYAQVLLDELHAGVKARDVLHILAAKGLGYALSTTEELKFIKEVAETTGVILDPVYSGKAAYGFLKDMKENPTKWEGKRVLFIHTGGIFALYDKATKIMSTMIGRCKRMEIDDSVPPKDASQFW